MTSASSFPQDGISGWRVGPWQNPVRRHHLNWQRLPVEGDAERNHSPASAFLHGIMKVRASAALGPRPTRKAIGRSFSFDRLAGQEHPPAVACKVELLGVKQHERRRELNQARSKRSGKAWKKIRTGGGAFAKGARAKGTAPHANAVAQAPTQSLPPTSPKRSALAPPATAPTAAKALKVTFALFEPNAKHVSLCGEFNGWAAEATPMERDDGGNWETTIALPPGRYEYKFIVDGQWMPDPQARESVWNCHGTLNSVVQVWA